MNWLSSFNETLDFIEDNIFMDIDTNCIEKISYTSFHHFNRMFLILSGISLKEYIRKRRLTLAGNDVLSSNEKVIDIALKYLYQTPESFSKAFKRFHGMSPSDARKRNGPIKTFPKLSFQLTIQGGKEMEYEITKKGNLNFKGYEIDVTTVDGKNFEIIPKFWQEVMTDGRFGNLIQKADDLGIVGICYDWKLESNTFKYMIAVRTNEEVIGATNVSFEDDVFASFKAVGKLPESIQRTAKYIYSEWFPSVNYEHSAGPELEIYPTGNTDSEDYVSYYLVPVKKTK